MADRMDRSLDSPGGDLNPTQLAYRQAMKYGTDLRRVYLAEKSRRQELELSNQLFNAIFSSTPTALVVLDSTLTIRQANPIFTTLLELDTDSIRGKPLREVIDEETLFAALHDIDTSRHAPTQIELQLEQPVKRSLLVDIARLRAGNFSGWIIVFHDQTERRRLDYQKSEFINIAAHELRTPLTSIIGLSELLKEGYSDGLADDQRQCVSGILEGGKRLANIVDQLVAFTQLTEGKVALTDSSEYNLLDVIRDEIVDLQTYAETKEITLKLETSPLEIKTNINPVLLRTTIHQLLLNGINFNEPTGSVAIRVERTDEHVTIQVIDDGLGIPRSELESIFQPFFQVEDHNIRRVGGLGLGLSIVKRVVAELGGVLSVDSIYRQGSTFTITVPLKRTNFDGELAVLQDQLRASHEQSLAYARDIQALYRQQHLHIVNTLSAITETLEARDPFVAGHTERVTELSLRLGQLLGLSKSELRTLETASRIHDIGKIGVSDDVLNNVDGLPDHEYMIVQHIEKAREILDPLTFLDDAIPIALSHHERYDGQGYPGLLVGEDIPFGARILAVANDFDVMTSPRPQREALSTSEALDAFSVGAGTHWDPQVVEALIALMSTSPK
ncbi:MAG: HD domain-containing protein [Anaerolineae bacterium]|nr:HD domain-containing protein [Anaerolineae bacterium]